MAMCWRWHNREAAGALWIVPSPLLPRQGSKTRIQWPWFILFFCLAAMANTYLLAGLPVYQLLSKAGKLLLIFTLFLIGATLSPAALRKVGPRPLVQGVLLWLVVGAVSLLAIRSGWIGI